MFKLITTAILDFLFPIACVGACGAARQHCCEKCFETLQRNSAQDFNGFVTATCNLTEKSMLNLLVHRFKYDGAKEIGVTLARLFPETPPNAFGAGEKILIPVPLHFKRLNWRGFNQSEILAHCIAKKWSVKVEDILERVRNTKPQAELGREKRLTNVKNAFSLRGHFQKISPHVSCILIDDVYTTGSTMHECEKVLRASGAERVFGLVVGRAV